MSATDSYPDDWKKLPIPEVSPEQQAPVGTVDEEILTRKKADPKADIADLEVENDRLVAALYEGSPQNDPKSAASENRKVRKTSLRLSGNT